MKDTTGGRSCGTNSFRYTAGGPLLTPLVSKLWDSYVGQTRLQAQRVTAQRLSAAGRRGNWRRWKRAAAIDELLPMVKRIARDVRWMFAPHLDLRDLIQAGSLGLVKAAISYSPANAGSGGFESFAYFRVRGAIIDSQKRRAYREEGYISLQAIAEAHDGWLPPELERDRGPGPQEVFETQQLRERLAAAIAALPAIEQAVLRGQLAGQPLTVTAKQVGRSLTWTRLKLAAARERVAVLVRGD